jgi:polysaccharide biosynthesis protein PslG
MDRRVPRAAFGFVLAICTLALLASMTLARDAVARSPQALLDGVNLPSVGYGASAAEADSEIADARSLHARVVRVEVPWSVLEPREPEQLDPRALAFTDRLVNDAAGAGIRVIATIDSSPCWASTAPSPLLANCSTHGESSANGWPPRVPADYAAFAAYVARRYGQRLAAIEVWNEPDQSNEYYFAGPNKAKNYAAVLRAAYPAIKAADPSMTVLAGSIVGYNGAFLRLLYAAGIQGYYDGLAVHYYTLTLAALRSIHEVQLANHDSTPLWLDEFGWSSCWPQQIQQEQACVTAQMQATNLRNTLLALARTPYVAAAVIYKLRDSASQAFGLLAASGAPKPAFTAFANALTTPLASVARPTLSLRRQKGRVLASGSGPVGDYMQMEAFQGKVLRYHVIFTLDRFNRYLIALPSALGTRGLRVRVYQDWSGVATAAQRRI